MADTRRAFIDHRPRRRRSYHVARESLMLAGRAPQEVAGLLRGALYWAVVYGDGAVSLYQGAHGEILLHVRNTPGAVAAAAVAYLN